VGFGLAAGFQRALALAAVSLLAGVGAVAGQAVAERSTSRNLPAQVPAPGGGWYHALASAGGRTFTVGTRTNCGHVITAASLGIAHPTLVCDAKIWLRFGNQEVLTQVLAHGPRAPNYDFALTRALARRLGLSGIQPIEYRYAGSSG
jgi:hypothetical protein